jgi:hypothetical protein
MKKLDSGPKPGPPSGPMYNFASAASPTAKLSEELNDYGSVVRRRVAIPWSHHIRCSQETKVIRRWPCQRSRGFFLRDRYTDLGPFVRRELRRDRESSGPGKNSGAR